MTNDVYKVMYTGEAIENYDINLQAILSQVKGVLESSTIPQVIMLASQLDVGENSPATCAVRLHKFPQRDQSQPLGTMVSPGHASAMAHY